MSDARSVESSIGQVDLQQRADALIEVCLRDEDPSWPKSGDAALGEAVLERCDFHGTAPLLYQRLGATSGWPGEILEGLRRRSAAAAIWEEQHLRYLSSLLAELGSRGVDPVLLKGTALAYSYYDNAALRVRGDTDLLVPPTARDQAERLLGELDFRCPRQIRTEFVSHQAIFSARDELGLTHTIDLHWRISNGQVLSKLFSHAELRERAVPAPRLGQNAWVTARPDAILIACMHRKTHSFAPYWVNGVCHSSPDRFIWLYDLHVLAGGLTLEEQRTLVRRAHEKGLAGLCHDDLARAARALGTQLPAGLLEALDPGGRRELPRIYLDAGSLRREVLNLEATTGLYPKLSHLRERAFPTRTHMRERFGEVRPNWLPWLYVRRIVQGAARRLLGRQDGHAGKRGP